MLLGDISMFILRMVYRIDSNEIHLVFDHIVKPSIKDCERDSRSGIADRTESYVIVGPSQKRPNDFGAALRNDNFKTSFLKYLVSSWDNQQLQNIVESKVIYHRRHAMPSN